MPEESPTFSELYVREAIAILESIDCGAIDSLVKALEQVRAAKGRLFILGVGGSAAHASHAVCDFRKICEIEAYAATDNTAELTARTNDEGWETTFGNLKLVAV